MRDQQFLNDILEGLSQNPKRLYSKYFYDAKGDVLFQEIMKQPEYYLTNCELEIIKEQRREIIDSLPPEKYDLVELGAGDGMKSIYLLEILWKRQKGELTYFPIDISQHVLNLLHEKLFSKFPNLVFKGLAGDYFDEIASLPQQSSNPKLFLFLGSSIGNFGKEKALVFLKKLKTYFQPGDYLFLGLDLVKAPDIILAAYNDANGATRKFNFNLLNRINQELEGNFDLNNFRHTPQYFPNTGACKSFLKSLKDQEVQIDGHNIHFRKGEEVFMEISQKYTLEEVDKMAEEAGFERVKHFFDSKKWFLDTLWKYTKE